MYMNTYLFENIAYYVEDFHYNFVLLFSNFFKYNSLFL